jgi:hypothetical protein
LRISPLIHVGCRELEGVLDQFAAGLGFAAGDYFYNVEVVGDFGDCAAFLSNLAPRAIWAFLNPMMVSNGHR